MSPYILSKKIGDSNVTLLNDGLTINLPCDQVANEYSLGKRILWFFSGCSCEYYMILRIIKDPRRPSLSCQRTKVYESLNFYFTTTYDSIDFIFV